MAITPTPNSPRGQSIVANPGSKRPADNPVVAEKPTSSPTQQNRVTQNVAILQANQDMSLKSNNGSLSLLYKTAIESINAELKSVAGENAAQKIYESDTDTSAEATAERIVAFATGFYNRYHGDSADTPPEQRLDNFISLMTKSIDKGFADANDILTKLKVNEGDIKADVDKTYQLVIDGLASFRQNILDNLNKSDTDAADQQ